jgi:hypothetical protein
MHISSMANMLYIASSLNTPDSDSILLKGLSTDTFTVTRTVTINNMGHITDITEDPATGTIWAVGFKMPTIPQQILLSTGPFYEPCFAKIPYGTNTVTAVPISSGTGNDLALPTSIVWAGAPAECSGPNLDNIGIVDALDFALFAAHWLESGCTAPFWCGCSDMNPDPADRGQVDITDLAIFAEHWL